MMLWRDLPMLRRRDERRTGRTGVASAVEVKLTAQRGRTLRVGASVRLGASGSSSAAIIGGRRAAPSQKRSIVALSGNDHAVASPRKTESEE